MSIHRSLNQVAQAVARKAGALLLLPLLLVGCTSFTDYVENGFKVGPNYKKPPEPVAQKWIDANESRVRSDKVDASAWWCAFQDPVLNSLIQHAYRGNFTVRSAGSKVLHARGLQDVAKGNLLPQQQQASAGYTRNELSKENPLNQGIHSRFFDLHQGGLNLSWELDFWGRFRRALEASTDDMDAEVENYDYVLVTLLADLVETYVEIRTLQARLALLRGNVENQRYVKDILEERFKKGAKNAELDYPQHKSQWEYTKSLIPGLEVNLRQDENKLCVLLGVPIQDLEKALGIDRIPFIPNPANPKEWNQAVIVGIPGDTLLRRPDIRHEERHVAAQCALIGYATSELYPHIAVTGTIGLESSSLATLLNTKAWYGSIGPSLSWDILNYGRLLNRVRAQDAKFQEYAANYQNHVLRANEQAENALIAFLKAHDRYQDVALAAQDAALANERFKSSFQTGRDINFNQWFNITKLKQQQEDFAAQAKGDIAFALAEIYRTLGGGWQIRFGAGCSSPELIAAQASRDGARLTTSRRPTTPSPQASVDGNGSPPSPRGQAPLAP